MASAIPRDRLKLDAVNFIPARSMGKINRYAGGGHGGGAIVDAEEVPMMDSATLAKMEEEQIMEGMEEFADRRSVHGSTGFSGYFKEKAASSDMPRDMMEALAEEEPEFSQQDRGQNQERDSYGDLDNTEQGESPASGHRPVAGKIGYKQKVYIASLDVLGSVYEDNGSTVTVKTVHGKWIDVSKKDIEVVKQGGVNDSGTGTPMALSPRKREQEDGNGEVRDSDNEQESMSAFSAREDRAPGGSYAERRRSRR